MKCLKANSNAAFSKRDTGIGIPADKLDDIFNSFEQIHTSANAKYGGTGLGLTISRQLVELMGGEIEVESTEYGGSTFSFTIDLEVGNLFIDEDVPANDNACSCRPMQLLVAEDNRINQVVIRNLLEDGGHVVEIVQTGKEAIERLAQKKFDAVLMDIRMPEMNGDEATRIIRNEPPDCVDPTVPIIALTAYALHDEIDQYMQSGFNAYLTKPIEAEKLNKVFMEF